MKICLYGAGSEEIDESYMEVGYELGEEIAKRGHELIFGGGNTGMMGAVSNGVIDNNGEVLGIAPEWMNEWELINENCNEFIKTETMDERKNLFLEKSDAFIISPGGIGTLDEFFEILTLKKLQRHNKAIVIFNINNFYNILIEMIDFMIEEKTIAPNNIEFFKVTYSVKETLDYIENYL